jgi:SAM-dependent methyltransferase
VSAHLPVNTVRGAVRAFVAAHAPKLGLNILEIGSRLPHADAWWANNRTLVPEASWIGIDIQEGLNVDMVCDAEQLRRSFAASSFTGVLCSEVLEHVRYPHLVLRACNDVLMRDGHLVVTTPFAFPEHNFPSDYWRFTREGLRVLLEDASFEDILVGYSATHFNVRLDDHGEGLINPRTMPYHTFAIARKRC